MSPSIHDHEQTKVVISENCLHNLFCNAGTRMFYNTQDMLWRRKLEEQADLQQALELQALRVMSLQLADVKKPHYHHTPLPTCSPIPSPTHSPNPFNQTLVFHSIPTNSQVLQGTFSLCCKEVFDYHKLGSF